jgi:hypothetical protein
MKLYVLNNIAYFITLHHSFSNFDKVLNLTNVSLKPFRGLGLTLKAKSQK